MGSPIKRLSHDPAVTEPCRFENYEMQEINRQQLQNAPYNPRMISGKAKKLLKKNLEAVGLVAPITWNKRTGNIVSGHQRVEQMDALMGTFNYTMKVAVVDMDEKTEKEQSVFMNNTEAQGDFDMEKLEDLVIKQGLDVQNMGFDAADVFKQFGALAPDAAQEELAKMSNRLKESQEAFDKIYLREDQNDSDFYLVVVFKDYEARKEFTDRLGAEDNRYLDGKVLQELVPAAEQKKAREA